MTSVREFQNLLFQTVKEKFPDIELNVVVGGDHWQSWIVDVVRQGEALFRYKPYVLYQEGLETDDFEGVILRFLEACGRAAEGSV